MYKKSIWMVTLAVLCQGCVDMRVAMINPKDAKGRDVDLVVFELKKNGLMCGNEYRGKLSTGNVSRYLTVKCVAKEAALFCPESYRVYVDFDPETRTVSSLKKFSETNCF
jgi:hypothetical protein